MWSKVWASAFTAIYSTFTAGKAEAVLGGPTVDAKIPVLARYSSFVSSILTFRIYLCPSRFGWHYFRFVWRALAISSRIGHPLREVLNVGAGAVQRFSYG